MPSPEEKLSLQDVISLDEIFLKFAKHEQLLAKVSAELVVQAARNQAITQKMEGLVWSQFSQFTPEFTPPVEELDPSGHLSDLRPSLGHSKHSLRLFSCSFHRSFSDLDEVSRVPSNDDEERRVNVYKPAKNVKDESVRAFTTDLSSGACARGMRRFLSSFASDLMMGIVIALNLVVMICQVQWQGYENAFALGLRTDDGNWGNAEEVFEGVEKAFISIYLFDVILRLIFLPLKRLRSPLEFFDTIVVLVCAVEAYILRPSGLADWDALVILRLLRCFRILRVVRMFRFMKLFQALHILIQTMGGMLVDLFWGTLLLLITVLASGLLMATLAHYYIQDDSVEMTTRQFLYERFGHADSSFYYMFEAATTTAWVSSAAPLIFEVNKMFALLWIPFVIFVNFAMMRVIAALFLKETLEMAAKERERVAQDAAKTKDRMAQSLKVVFKLADDTGDGCVEHDSFLTMLQEESVISTLNSMGVNHHEVRALVDLLSEGGLYPIPISDFLHAALTMHESAKTIHMMQTAADIARLERELTAIGTKQDEFLKRRASQISQRT